MSFVKEFKEFAMKGNVVDLAVGVIIGGSFGKIVSSLVADVFMPVIGYIVGGVNFTDLKFTLGAVIEGQKPATINYGNFVQTIFDFTIVAFAIFMAIKALNRLKKKEEETPAAPAEPTEEVKLLREIRDSLQK